jgi:negative regulator of sigma-B (phosphoserine phosphatase)
MRPAVSNERPVVALGVAARAMSGQAVSGDAHFVRFVHQGVMLAVADGLGHGQEAAAAARAAMEIVGKYPAEPVIPLLTRCHAALLKTRGAVMTVAAVDALAGTLTWLGVGNVEGRLIRAHPEGDREYESVLLRGGLLGAHLPSLHFEVLSVALGDLIILATDGIRPEFADGLDSNRAPEQIASDVLRQHFKGTDDALVLVARYLGMSHE